MSFNLPSVKAKPENAKSFTIEEGSYGVPNPLMSGIGSSKATLGTVHPLETSESNYHQNELKMNLTMLKNMQGLHAPLKLSMEMKFAKKVGRLPFLPSSNMQLDIVTGNYIDIGFEDILNTPEFCEVSGQPHAVIEKSIGVL